MRILAAKISVAVTALVLFTPVVSVRAQSGTAALTGRVTDQQGAIVPGATVTLKRRATGAVRTLPTNESGVYQATSLAPGHYDVTVELTGFKSVTVENVELRVDTTARIADVKLELGNLAESVIVA